MKITKTILAFVVALSLALTMSISAFATSSASISAPAKVTEGETFTVKVAVSNAASGDLPLTYSTEYLEVVDTESLLGGEVGSIAESAGGKVYAGFAVADNVTADVYSVTFKALSAVDGVEGEAKLSVDGYVIDADDNQTDVKSEFVVDIVEAEEDTTKADEDTTKADEDTTKADEDTTKADEDTTKADEDTTKADEDTTKKPDDGTKATDKTPKTGTDVSLSTVAGLSVLAAAAFVLTKKRK